MRGETMGTTGGEATSGGAGRDDVVGGFGGDLVGGFWIYCIMNLWYDMELKSNDPFVLFDVIKNEICKRFKKETVQMRNYQQGCLIYV